MARLQPSPSVELAKLRHRLLNDPPTHCCAQDAKSDGLCRSSFASRSAGGSEVRIEVEILSAGDAAGDAYLGTSVVEWNVYEALLTPNDLRLMLRWQNCDAIESFELVK
jgi:hypothetical protein